MAQQIRDTAGQPVEQVAFNILATSMRSMQVDAARLREEMLAVARAADDLAHQAEHLRKLISGEDEEFSVLRGLTGGQQTTLDGLRGSGWHLGDVDRLSDGTALVAGREPDGEPFHGTLDTSGMFRARPLDPARASSWVGVASPSVPS